MRVDWMAYWKPPQKAEMTAATMVAMKVGRLWKAGMTALTNWMVHWMASSKVEMKVGWLPKAWMTAPTKVGWMVH